MTINQASQVQMFYQAQAQSAEQDKLFLLFVQEGLTREQLKNNIEKRPALWGKYESWLDKLPEKKYVLTDNKITIRSPVSGEDIELSQIQAVRDFQTAEGEMIEKDSLGGFIASESNLSHAAGCWVGDQGRVFENGRVVDNALIYDEAIVYGNAIVSGAALVENFVSVSDDAVVTGNAYLFGDAMVYGQSRIKDNAVVGGDALVGGEAVIEKTGQIQGDQSVYQGVYSAPNRQYSQTY